MEMKRRGRPRKNIEPKVENLQPKKRGRPPKVEEVPSISKGRHSGIPLSEEEYKEWQKVFTDIEDLINNL